MEGRKKWAGNLESRQASDSSQSAENKPADCDNGQWSYIIGKPMVSMMAFPVTSNSVMPPAGSSSSKL